MSVLEAVAMAEAAKGKSMNAEYVEEHRRGDHICYISNLRKLRVHFPGWRVEIGLPRIFEELAATRKETSS